ncbi:alpha/beta hydrolase [Amycolatopsis sp. NPDC059027]|uniref:putative alpha/beta hydrolase n=1 Tax=unclassified Amycolatopsis TaxID=2618356 RepID=UPI0036704BCE
MPLSNEDLAARAGIDPWKLRDQLAVGDPIEITNLAAHFAKAGGNAKLAGELGQQASRLTASGYKVDSTPVHDEAGFVASTKTKLGAGNLTKIATMLDGIADDLTSATNYAKANVTTLEGNLQKIQQQYDAVASTAYKNPGTTNPDAQAKALLAQAVALVKTSGQAIDKVHQAYDKQLAAHNKALSALGFVAPGGLDEGSGAPVTLPPKGADPKTVAAWWKGLTPEQRQYAISYNYREIGNLNGVPATDRDKANRVALSVDQHSDNPDVRRNAQAVVAALREGAGHRDPVTGQPVVTQLYLYEPSKFGGKGRIAISVGDLDTAANTSVYVPGISNNATTLPSTNGEPGGVTNAGNIYREARNATPGKSAAVLAWFGYDIPPAAPDPTVVSEGPATEGGGYLANDLAGLRAIRGGNQPHLTVVGHSYGSTVVGHAGSDHHAYTAKDDVVLVGSIGAGAGTTNAAQIHPDAPDRVYVGTASHDKIAQIGGLRATGANTHGANPTDLSFGAHRFRAETTEPLPWDAHGHYFTDQNREALYNVSAIVAGDYQDVQSAPHSLPDPPVPGRPPTDTGNVDPETLRPPGRPSHYHDRTGRDADDPAQESPGLPGPHRDAVPRR